MKIIEPERRYNFWLRGGHIVDPARGIDGEGDILIRNSKIVELPENGHIDQSDVKEIINCSGYYIFPGLIDHHVHFSWNTSGIQPDLFCIPNGVTAAVDAGSIGTNAFENFVRNRIMPAMMTLKASVNVTTGGLAGAGYMENISPELYDVRAMEYLFERYRSYIYGLKLRIGKDISEGKGLKPLVESVKLARKFETRLSLHATFPLEPMTEIISCMGKGDVLCHSFQAMGTYSILDKNRKIHPEVWQARERGVIFDSAQGRIHCAFPVASAAIEQGFLPDVISTDLITFSAYQERLFSLPVTMARFLALGMTLNEVVRCCTETPAELMGMQGEIGTLKPGALADVSIMKIIEGKFDFRDSYGNHLSAYQLLVPQMTLKAGRTCYRSVEFMDMVR
ncbi:MAG: amidohydrolase family protein [Clostridiales bacterium]|nr:amidohydrolase family protein [Clostridiales bacterium]